MNSTTLLKAGALAQFKFRMIGSDPTDLQVMIVPSDAPQQVKVTRPWPPMNQPGRAPFMDASTEIDTVTLITIGDTEHNERLRMGYSRKLRILVVAI